MESVVALGERVLLMLAHALVFSGFAWIHWHAGLLQAATDPSSRSA
jgi:hypothetical protein